MKKDAETGRVSPLAGTERAFLEGRREELRAGYEAEVQALVDAWEASAGTVAALGRKRFRDVRLATFFGTVALRCREGFGADGRWTCPALAHLGLRPNQRYSPDMERRMAVLAAETGSYEKAARVADAAAWFAASDGAVRSAVPADTSPYDFGVLLYREAVRMGLLRAKAVFFVMDGGVWLWRIYEDRFEKCSKAMLDFYHLSQHLHVLAAALHGADSAKAQAWCGRLLHDLKHKSSGHLFKTLDDLLREPPSDDPAVLEAIREQNAYFRSHAHHMDYAANARMGVPVGSGSVESLCSQFQNRLKRTGQFWTKQGFAALLRIVVRYWNGELDYLWTAAAA